MGCVQSLPGSAFYGDEGVPRKPPKIYRKPRWKSDELLTPEMLQSKRDEFWDTQPHYGGDKVIWDALKAACETDLPTAKLIIDTAAITVGSKDMTIFYDERGAKYELPKYVVSAPVNLVIAE